jgi:hypothetical protein
VKEIGEHSRSKGRTLAKHLNNGVVLKRRHDGRQFADLVPMGNPAKREG